MAASVRPVLLPFHWAAGQPAAAAGLAMADSVSATAAINTVVTTLASSTVQIRSPLPKKSERFYNEAL